MVGECDPRIIEDDRNNTKNSKKKKEIKMCVQLLLQRECGFHIYKNPKTATQKKMRKERTYFLWICTYRILVK